MLTETLRLFVVFGAVAASSRFANPSLIEGVAPETSTLIQTVLGAGIGYIVGGVIARRVDRLLHHAEDRLASVHASEILAATVGFLVGGLGAALVAWPIIALVPQPYVSYPAAGSVVVVAVTFSSRLAVRKRLELFGVLGVVPAAEAPPGGCLLDSSAAIDGRVLDLHRAGLLPSPVCVPSFIVWEMQSIADSGDPTRRKKGRRGLDVLASMREAGADVRVLDEDPVGSTEQDTKLTVVARRRGMPIVTADSNLAKAAEAQGIKVLNLHVLSELLRPAVQAGDVLRVSIEKTGKEPGQGVGYLDDGTMVVIDGAADLQGADVDAEVRSVIRTATGRMVFASPVSSESGA